MSKWVLSVLRTANQTSFLSLLPNKSLPRRVISARVLGQGKGGRLISERKQVLALYNILDNGLAK